MIPDRERTRTKTAGPLASSPAFITPPRPLPLFKSHARLGMNSPPVTQGEYECDYVV